ncbi:NAD-dependent succinate-semialdehyde dehydrogenase [Maribacter sp. X9]|uniref:NAD-dependent succinate-semialdehyde dehydrogenase n=1 Tax=Maribacter sp. X9 TaxID=3402159 RepID=UPI003AF3332B
MKDIQSKNPYNGTIIDTYTQDTEETLHSKLQKALNIEASWGNTAVEDRCDLLSKVADLLLERKEQYAELMTKEMGKPISQSISEIEKCAWACDFYALNAEDFLADELISTDADESFISYDPLGCILAVMPWNYPFWQVIRFAAPTLTAGNTALLKHAENVTGCSFAIQQLFLDAGYPEGCFQSVVAGHDKIENLIANNGIKAVTLTGSEKAGKAIAKTAGENLKKTVLELGGNNACIVWEDADLEKYMDIMVTARMQNTGQSCIAAKRFIVCEEIYDAFLEKFIAKVKALKIGDPMDEETFIGVMAREDLADTLQKQIDASIEKGATVVLGNDRNGAYFSPSILTHVTADMPIFEEETFGPVAAVIKAKDRKEAIAMAVDSRFGLGSMLFTEDIDEAFHMVSKIPDGAFFVNEMVKSDPRLPFGGTKASGYGRELSREGILEFVNKKTVYIKK